MKKGIIIGGVIVLLLGAAGTCLTLAKDARTAAIKAALDALESGSVLTEKELELYDMNGSGSLTQTDLILAKCKALIGSHGDAVRIYVPTEAKQIGRTAYHEDTKTLWCSLSGSGIVFTFTGESCTCTLVADSSYSGGDSQAARYAYYVNDVLQAEAQLTEAERTVEIPAASDTTAVRIVKLSESAQSSFGIRDITVKAADQNAEPALEAAPAKAHLIEFIGDSITCGYGVDGEFGVDTFKTANENAVKAYAVQTAYSLDADYSLVSYSGHGVVSGYTTAGKLNSAQTVPPLYDQIGASYATVESGKKIGDDKWDFSVQPDLIVINLGTNDASYTGSDKAKQQEFSDAYVSFLKQIREKNPNAPILCTLGIMGQNLCKAIQNAVTTYTEETGDTNINTMWFDVQSQDDGLGVDWHPSALTHQKAAETLSAFIREWLGW